MVDVLLLFSDSLAVGSTIKDRNVCFKSTATQIVNEWRRGGVEWKGEIGCEIDAFYLLIAIFNICLLWPHYK